MQDHDHSVSAVYFILFEASETSLSENLLISISRDHTLKIWDVSTEYCVKTLQDHTDWVQNVYSSFNEQYLLSTEDDITAWLWNIFRSNSENKLIMFDHEHFNECCALVSLTLYQYLASLIELKKSSSVNSTAEFMTTESQDKTIKLWVCHRTCIMILVDHDNWVQMLTFHSDDKYLLSVSDNKTLWCWNLSQERKCVRALRDTHGHFITCLRWALGISKDVHVPAVYSGAAEGNDEKNNAMLKSRGTREDTVGVQIRRVIATEGVDWKLRIFTNWGRKRYIEVN